LSPEPKLDKGKTDEGGLTRRLRWTGQSRAAFERQHLTGSFYLFHSFSVIVAQPLSFTFGGDRNDIDNYII